jgi:hypothetical protein
MTRSDEPLFEPRIADWLEDDPHTAPDQALNIVLAAFPSIKQRRTWRAPWRAPNVNGLTRPLVAAVTVVVLAVGGVFVLNRSPSGPGAVSPSPTASAIALPSDSPSPATTVAPSPTKPPLSFTSPLYGYTVSWPPGTGWVVTPTKVPWAPGSDPSADYFAGPAGAYQDFDDVYVAAQPVPEGMTPEAWLLDYAQHVAASGRDCKGPVDAWTDAVVGSLAIRRLDLVCQEIRLSDVGFVVDGTGYVMTGNRDVIALFLETFQPGA